MALVSRRLWLPLGSARAGSRCPADDAHGEEQGPENVVSLHRDRERHAEDRALNAKAARLIALVEQAAWKPRQPMTPSRR